MRKAYGDDFADVPAWSLGDFSCDGYLRITRTVFACYAPKSMRTRPTVVVQKIRSDHAGALEHWKALMSEWRVVHNDDEGLPPAYDLSSGTRLQFRMPSSQAGTSEFDRPRLLFRFKALPLSHLSRFRSVSKSYPAGRRNQFSLEVVRTLTNLRVWPPAPTPDRDKMISLTDV